MFASISNRFNTFLLVLLVLMAASIIAMLATRLSAGPLDPPGPPSSTLPLVEPRIPISSLPYTISSGGSYYVTKDLSSTTGGITISTEYVVLDLNGFSLTGTAGFSGIDGASSSHQVTVRNGRVHFWGTGISLAGDDNEADDLVVSSNTVNGLLIGDRGVVRRARAVGNAGTGIGAFGAGDRISVFDSQADYNTGDGISATQGASRIEGNTVNFNAGHGINVTNDNVVIGNTLQSNNTLGTAGGSGIFVDGSRNRVDGNGVRVTVGGEGIYVTGGQNTVNDNLVAANGVDGIRSIADGNMITNNEVSKNTRYGMEISGSGNYIAGNTVDGNGTIPEVYFAGIYVSGTGNRIEGNHSANNNGSGFFMYGSGNAVFRNSAGGNPGGNYSVIPTNDLGPIGTAATATSPWANISN